MSKVDSYRQTLRAVPGEWEPYLRAESGLPGPRGNLELAQAAAELASPEQVRRWLALDATLAPANTPDEFLTFCGVEALGYCLAADEARSGFDRAEILERLRRSANDPRWRTREAAAIALQVVGDADPDMMFRVAEDWSRGSLLEQRAAAAAVCEPRLLSNPPAARRALALLDGITTVFLGLANRKSEDFRILRKALAYCWSVAAAALPVEGKPLLEKWLVCSDRDIAWIMRENLKKDRLRRMDPAWLARWKQP